MMSYLVKLENLQSIKIQEFYSTPEGVKFTVFVYGKLILIGAYTYNIEQLKYGVQYKYTLPSTIKCLNTASSITGNNGSAGQFTLNNNILIVQSTNSQLVLSNTFMGQLVTFLE